MTPERKAELRAEAKKCSADTVYFQECLGEALDALDEAELAYGKYRDVAASRALRLSLENRDLRDLIAELEHKLKAAQGGEMMASMRLSQLNESFERQRERLAKLEAVAGAARAFERDLSCGNVLRYALAALETP